MDRATLITELDAYIPADLREAAMVRDVAHFVRTRADCFERSAPLGHVTASAWIIDDDGSHALLTHHRKLDRWLQLGGHADGDADVRAVARREALEESGLTAIRFASDAIYDVDVHVIPARPAEPAHRHYDIRFAFRADRGRPLIVSAESHALAWLPVTDLLELGTDPSVRRLALKTVTLA